MNTEEVKKYLEVQYEGVCSEEQIQLHIKEYVGFVFAEQAVNWIMADGNGSERILDIGSGYGSFVLLSRKKGVDAVGIEMAEFEIEFARERLKRTRPSDDPGEVYIKGDACSLPFPSDSFGVVTMWNVLEHIKDVKKLIKEISRVLKPYGHVYIICPNYAAFRDESHYHIQWFPLLPPVLARLYLKMRKKNPEFFNNFIFYRTNWGVLRLFIRNKFVIFNLKGSIYFNKISNPDSIRSLKIRNSILIMEKLHLIWILKIFIIFTNIRTMIFILNPLKNSVILHMQKRGEI